MSVRILFVFIISIVSTYASDIKLTYGLFNYHYESSKNAISMKGKQLSLNLPKSDCNSSLVKNFETDIKKTLDRMIKQKSPIPGGMEIALPEEKIYQSRTTPAGKFFLKLPDSFKKLITANKFKCGTK